MYKRLLYIEDLYEFYSKNFDDKSVHFSYKDKGEPIVVQVHGSINFEDTSDIDGLMPVHLQACHTLKNRNNSNIEKDVMTAALPSFKNRPILGYIHKVPDENGDEQYQFYAHNIHEEGDEVIHDEFPVGIVPESCNAKLVYDKEKKKTYCEVDGYIFEEYSKAAEILRREEESAVSVEISIRDLEYNAKEKYLDIKDFYFSGVTILGKTPENKDVEPGMLGSNIKISDFSAENNSLFTNYSTQLIDLQTRLSNIESKLEKVCFNNNTQINQKGGKNLVKFEELLKKYNVTAEDIAFDYDGLSDEELEQKFAETFDDDGGAASDDGAGDASTTDGNSDPEPTSDENADEGNGETDPVEEPGNEEGTGETQEEDPVSEDEPVATSDDSEENPVEEEACGTDGKKKKKYSITVDEKSANFEIALDEKIWALSDLVNIQYGESDNCWYSVKVYENYLIMSDYWTGIAYKQTYSQDGDNFSLTGDRVEVYATYLTKEELDEVEAMRSNYASLVEYKENAEFAKLHTQREEILNAEKYNNLRDTNEFKTLVENMDQYSLVDLEKEAKVIFADFITSNAGTFSAHTSETKSKKKFNGGMTFGVGSEKPEADNENSPYGDYFKSLKK